MSEPARTEPLRWGVIGGGMLGLALARRLAAHGQQVTVLEGAPEIGGLAGAWQIGDIVWDRHYHVTLLSDLRLRELLRELGLESEMRWVETRTGFYTDGQLYSMSNTLEFLRFPPLRLVDKLRLGATIFAASRIKDWQSLERVLVADWLRKWSGERTFRKIWQPLLEAKLGDCYRKTAASFIWATIQRMYAARHSGLKKEMFGYVRGGYARMLERFAEALEAAGVELRTGCRVSSVTAQPDGQVLVETNRGSQWFDRVVLTTPSSVIAQMCPQLGDDERQRHESVEYLGIACASVLLDRPLASYYVTNITDAGLPFTAVIEMTTLVDPQELGGNHLAYLPRYAAADDEAWSWSDHEIEERFLAGLERMYPAFRREQVKAFRISRAKHVMALPTLEYSLRMSPMATAAANVYAVNSAHIVKGTLNVNEVLMLADDAFERVLAPSMEDRREGDAPAEPSAGVRFTARREPRPPEASLEPLGRS
ncbi:MAG TPA: NAD(P)/FAD-dependent oxidoreductase [Lacipirellula sp.]